MKIAEDHFMHGAALIQIAEHSQRTSINALKLGRVNVRSAYLVNNDIALYCKYAKTTSGSFDEYGFVFSKEQLAILSRIAKKWPNTFLALVCVKDKEICCIEYTELDSMHLQRRKAERAKAIDSLSVLVTCPHHAAFRVYVNEPGRRKTILGEPLLVSRNTYPDTLFAK